MGPRGGTNTKVQAALEKKKTNQAVKDAKEAQKRAMAEAQEWEKGANTRKQNRMEADANKADEMQRKKREKEELLRQEEEAMGSGKAIKSVGSGMKSKQQKKKKNKNDFSMLEDALVSAADKKTKAAKRAERLKKEAEEQKQKELALKKATEEANVDPLLANTNAMIGMSINDNDGDLDSDGYTGRQANIQRGQASEGSGLEGAIQALSIGGGAQDQHPEKRMKALHKAFEERMMPQMKDDYPGLKMSQYKEKIFTLWKKSPENPMNQQI